MKERKRIDHLLSTNNNMILRRKKNKNEYSPFSPACPPMYLPDSHTQSVSSDSVQRAALDTKIGDKLRTVSISQFHHPREFADFGREANRVNG